MLAEMVFVSATDDVNVLVKTPLPLVVPEAGVSVFPLPEAVTVTLAPLIVAPLPSLAVTVIVEDPDPAVKDVGDAVTVELVAETPVPPPPPPPPEIWQAVLPVSVYVLPAIGMNRQATLSS